MIEFVNETEFELNEKSLYPDWITRIINGHEKEVGDLCFIFCNDEYLHGINMKYLKHDTYTDIITFDYVDGNYISGDIFISLDRIKENAVVNRVCFLNELLRVMSHGVLHLIGFKDKTEADAKEMRLQEDKSIKMFHVEQ